MNVNFKKVLCVLVSLGALQAWSVDEVLVTGNKQADNTSTLGPIIQWIAPAPAPTGSQVMSADAAVAKACGDAKVKAMNAWANCSNEAESTWKLDRLSCSSLPATRQETSTDANGVVTVTTYTPQQTCRDDKDTTKTAALAKCENDRKAALPAGCSW